MGSTSPNTSSDKSAIAGRVWAATVVVAACVMACSSGQNADGNGAAHHDAATPPDASIDTGRPSSEDAAIGHPDATAGGNAGGNRPWSDGGATGNVGGQHAFGGEADATRDAATRDAATPGHGDGEGRGGSDSGSAAAFACTTPCSVRADFQSRALAPYAEAMVLADFGGEPTWNDGLTEGRAAIIVQGTEHFLRVTYPADWYGPDEGGVQFLVPLARPYQELYFAYRIRFAPGFQFVKGGKLPGLVGGTAPTGCVADPEGFSARGMWRSEGAAVQYLYFPEKVASCGDDYPYELQALPVRFVPGQWHTVEQRILMNTPGDHDGVLQAWFDGALVLDDRTFLYRLAGATFQINALYFSTFFGGSDDTWAPTVDQSIDFDDLAISTGPIAH